MRFSELKQKEVINCRDCKRLGYIADLELDICSGYICGIIVPGPGKFLSCFGIGSAYYIQTKDIVRIGPDIVLVDICLEEALIKNDKDNK